MIEGIILSIKANHVLLKQDMTGDVYKCEKSHVKIFGKNGVAEKVNGKDRAKVFHQYASLVRFHFDDKSVDYTENKIA